MVALAFPSASGTEGSDGEGDGDVEITLELPQGKVDALVTQLGEDSALRRSWHLGHVASVEPAAEPQPGPVSGGVHLATSQTFPAAVTFDPVKKLARLRDLQCRFGEVKERRRRAKESARVLETLPQPGDSREAPQPHGPSYEQLMERMAQGGGSDVGCLIPGGALDATTVGFPPPEGLPFPHRGVPGVLPPTVAPPPERELDPTDAAADMAWLAELADEGGRREREPPPPETLFQKEGLDMALDNFQADAARMRSHLQETGRVLEERAALAELRELGASPAAQQQFLSQQRVIHEQQRLREELEREREIERERKRGLERGRRTGAPAMPAGPSPDDARAAGLEGPGGAGAGTQHAVFRHLSPDGTWAERAAPRSYFPEDRPPSRQFQQELASRAERENWPEASALPSPSWRAALTSTAAAQGPRAPASPERGEGLAESREKEVRRPSFAGQGFFAGFEGRSAQGALGRAPSATPRFAAFAGFGAESSEGTSPRSIPTQPGAPRPESRSATPSRRASSRRRSGFQFGAGQDRAGGSSPPRPPGRSSFLGTAPAAKPRARRRSVRSSRATGADSGGQPPPDGEQSPSFFSSFFGAPAPAAKAGAAGPSLHARRPPDPGDRYVDGACLDLAPPLCPPDLAAIQGAGPTAVEEAYEQALTAQRGGLLGERDAAQVVLDYVAAVAGSAEALARDGDVSAHVRLVSDLLAFYPKCVQIHLWGLEALMNLFQHEDWERAESLARPIIDTVTDLMDTHERSPSLHDAVPDLPKRMLAALALVLTPSTSARLNSGHVDFALRVIQDMEGGPIVTEHGLHVLLDARSPHRLREQAEAARDALRGFRSEPRLAPRALLALREAYVVASEHAIGASAGGELDLSEPAVASSTTFQGARVPLGLREITTAMDLYAQDRKIQGAGAMALAAAVCVPRISLAAASQEGAIRAMALAQQRFSSSRSVALQFCKVMRTLAQREPELLSVEAALDVIQAGLTFQRDNEIAIAALEALHSFAPRLRELATGPSERLVLFARDLVQLGEGRHTDPYALGLLVVVLVVVASNGLGSDPGGTAGHRWRSAFGRAAVVVLPLRALYEHPADSELACASAIALRCLTYGCAASSAHAGRVKAASVLLATLARHVAHPDISRELLSALGNCASDRAVFQEFQGIRERVQNVIYEAMESCSRHEPDVLMQGCRALAALGARPDMARVNVAMLSAGVGACERAGEEVEHSFFSLFGRVEISEQVTWRRDRLAELCGGLLHPERALRLAAGPHFGRLVDEQGEPTPECLAHRRGSASGDSSARRPKPARRHSSVANGEGA